MSIALCLFKINRLPILGMTDKNVQVWAGNEDDCRDVTWEECNPLEKTVPMSVAKMICVDMPVRFSHKT